MASYFLNHEDFYSNNTSYYYWPAFLASSSNSSSATNLTGVYDSVVSDVVGSLSHEYQKWLFSITGCLLVGLSGVFPLLIFPNGECSFNSSSSSKTGAKDKATTDSTGFRSGVGEVQLQRLLNFAVGSLLGDVFLHLLPEAWNQARASGSSKHDSLMILGFWILIGLVSFVICGKLINKSEEVEEDDYTKEPAAKQTRQTEPSSKIADSSNNNVAKISQTAAEPQQQTIQLAGYLNLIANTFDNFTHGLAVAGSFIISPKIGFLTTTAILLHEIPHEIADFAILLRSGFNPWSAAKAQLSTATAGLAGALFTLSVDCMKTMGDFTWWILPFTSGCFINIALTNLLPDLMKEDNPKESVKQLASLLLGIGVMGALSLVHEG